MKDPNAEDTQRQLKQIDDFYKKYPELNKPVEEKKGWLVWSNEHDAWWLANRNGYTTYLSQAGVFTYEEATTICFDANINIRRSDSSKPFETMLPADMFL